MRGRLLHVALVALVACDGASNDPGYGAILQIPGAQFRPGRFPRPNGGPATLTATTAHASVTIGRVDESLQGVLEGGAQAAIVGIDGADGTWIVPAGPPGVDLPGSATLSTLFGLGRDTAPGPLTIDVAAVDAAGQIGAPATADIVAEPALPPDGDLVIELVWDSTADLDLHVVDPLGGEAYSRHPNTWQAPPPGEPIDPDAWKTGGILDHDGNASCHRDGEPREDVVWRIADGAIVAAGEYVVRVDTRSLCSDSTAVWSVAAYTTGRALIAAAHGVSIADDVLQPHDLGAGVTALRFTLP
jgi:hypothetical protein